MSALLLVLACAAPSSPPDEDSGTPAPDLSYCQQEPFVWYQDYYTRTEELCDPRTPVPERAWHSPLAERPDCTQAILEDMKFDFTTLRDNNFSPEDHPDGDHALTRLAMGIAQDLAYAMYYLMALDMGTLDDLRAYHRQVPGTLIHSPFIQLLEQISACTGEERMGPLLYNFIASAVWSTVAAQETQGIGDPYASVDLNTHQLFLTHMGVDWLLPILGHEAGHIWFQMGHQPCPEDLDGRGGDDEGDPVCDPSWGGAWGMHGGYLEWVRARTFRRNRDDLDYTTWARDIRKRVQEP